MQPEILELSENTDEFFHALGFREVRIRATLECSVYVDAVLG